MALSFSSFMACIFFLMASILTEVLLFQVGGETEMGCDAVQKVSDVTFIGP